MIQNIEKFLYHGSFYDNIDLSKAEYKECLFLTPNIRYALTYSGVDEDFGGYIFMYKVDSVLNIFNAADIDDRETLLAAFPEYKEYIDNMAEYEWLECFENFYNWAMSTGYDYNAKRGECTIDRINVDGNYEPSNCRWVDAKIQRSNQRPRKRNCK